ncbi:pseudouridine synthase [Bifidobacterium moukalabense]|uniref:pseudouridine synthase n=1 Tax=Bifidobacterium moukalabense TaxID=1333651 RepID=UPI001FCEA92D|nr:pseudouridine synthase [Bifidobacterium moukalabense]
MGGSQKKGRIILFGILAIIVLLVLGIGAGVLIGSRMAGSSRQATSSSSKTVQESPESSESLWHGKDIRKSGEGVYPGMDKERACTQAGVEAAYWLISGSGSQRGEELYKRFFLPNLVSADVDPESTAHWINHGDPPFTAVPVDIAADMLGTKIDDNAIGCVVSLDGKEHGKENIPNSSDPYPDSGVLYLQLNRKDKDSAWFVMSTIYNPSDYQRNIKQQGNN